MRGCCLKNAWNNPERSEPPPEPIVLSRKPFVRKTYLRKKARQNQLGPLKYPLRYRFHIHPKLTILIRRIASCPTFLPSLRRLSFAPHPLCWLLLILPHPHGNLMAFFPQFPSVNPRSLQSWRVLPAGRFDTTAACNRSIWSTEVGTDKFPGKRGNPDRSRSRITPRAPRPPTRVALWPRKAMLARASLCRECHSSVGNGDSESTT